jgi:hypothetical protein
LGHLSFGYLRKLQPHLFNVVHDSEFHCNICEMAKSHHITYLPSLNKSSEPFVVIHYDVWGSVKNSTIFKARYFVTFINECTRMTWMSLLHQKKKWCLYSISGISSYGGYSVSETDLYLANW